jgi:hypothetical protein
MSISLPSGPARLRTLPQTLTISRHIIAIAPSVNISNRTLRVSTNSASLTHPTQTQTQALPNHHVQSTQSQERIHQQSHRQLHPATSSRSFFAQTPPSQPLIHQAPRLGGVFLGRSAASFLATPKHTLSNLPQSFYSRRPLLTYLRAVAMSTLSQPQTPAMLGSPLREHRHRPVERLTDTLETPSLDDRSYRVIRLPNQLEVLLVHDADTDKSSAAMDVNVGNFSDEEDLPGTAHAVEHLLFMGTKKYPIENAYSQVRAPTAFNSVSRLTLDSSTVPLCTLGLI